MPGVGVKVLPVPFIALGRSQLLPTGRFVAGATEPLPIDEAFRHQHWITKVLLPIGRQPITDQLQHPRSQIGPLTGSRQHQKTGVLRDQMPPLFDLARGPVQPLIPQLDMKGRRVEGQQGDPLIPIFRDIPQHPPHRLGVLEIMLGDQGLIETLPLGVFDQANTHSLQQ